MKNSTYNVRSHCLDREEVARHDAVRLGAQELGPRRSATTRRRTETRAPQHRPDRRRAHPNAKLAQLTLDPHTTPPRILPREPQNQVPHRRIKRRPTGRAVPITPLPPHQLTMPTQQRLRRHQKHRPTIPRHKPTRSRKQQPITPPKRRPLHRTPKHRQLVTEHRILHLQRRHRRAPDNHAQQAPHHQVNQEQQHHTILRNTPFGRPRQSFRALHAPRGSRRATSARTVLAESTALRSSAVCEGATPPAAASR